MHEIFIVLLETHICILIPARYFEIPGGLMGYWDYLIFNETRVLDSTDASISILLTTSRFDIQGSITKLMFYSANEPTANIGSFSLDVRFSLHYRLCHMFWTAFQVLNT